jgi:hypothetical protein
VPIKFGKPGKFGQKWRSDPYTCAKIAAKLQSMGLVKDPTKIEDKMQNSLATIIGVLLGAAITGTGKLWSHCRKQKQIKATVKHDLQAIWGRLYPNVKDFMEECADQLEYIGITQNYLSCFEAIVGEIAVLSDSLLSQEIFDTYIAVRGIVDTILTNNQVSPGPDRMIYGQGVYQELADLEKKIKSLTEKL